MINLISDHFAGFSTLVMVSLFMILTFLDAVITNYLNTMVIVNSSIAKKVENKDEMGGNF
jgi:uncharacterized membrane protein (DUF485 family)